MLNLFNRHKPIVLETERLILRHPRKSDWKDILEGVSDISVARATFIPHPYLKRDAKQFLKKTAKKLRQKERKDIHFVLVLKKENKVIGSLNIHNINKRNQTATTGSWLNKRYRKKYYMTEAKIPVNNYAFNNLKLRKLETGVFAENKASFKTQKRMGYKKEGVRIKSVFCPSTKKIHDEILFGLLKEDWKKNLPKLKKYLEQKVSKLK